MRPKVIILPPFEDSPAPSLVSDATYESEHLGRPTTPDLTSPQKGKRAKDFEKTWKLAEREQLRMRRPVPPTPMLRMRGGRPTPTPGGRPGKKKQYKKRPVRPMKLPRRSRTPRGRPRKARSQPKRPPVPRKRPTRTKVTEQARPRPRKRQARRAVRSKSRTRDLAGLRPATFSIQKTGNTYLLAAREVNDSVMSQVKAFLNRKTGQPYVDSAKMTRPAALRYISANLGKKRVKVVFRRR